MGHPSSIIFQKNLQRVPFQVGITLATEMSK